MNPKFQTIADLVTNAAGLNDVEKELLMKAIKDADKTQAMTAFKLERLEKDRHTLSVMLEESIEDLQKKSKAVEAQNRELEIESALEKVRTAAMAMKEPDEMPEVCKIIARELDKLGVKEIRNVQTAIFYESRGTYMNYEYYAKHDKTVITETSYTNHKIHQAFADKMLKGPGEISITHIPGGELKDWIAYQKTTNVFIDTFLETASSLNYYWHSLGPVALGISTYVRLQDDELKLFHRFLNVFELAYTRYRDIEQAMMQAYEAGIEASLERVRAQAMSMMKSDELLKVCESVFNELKLLGFSKDDLRNVQIVINDDDNSMYDGYQYSDSTGGEIAKVPYDLHPIIRLLNDKLRQAKDAFADIEISGASLKDWKKFVNSFPQKHDDKLNTATELHYYFYSVGIGALGISSFKLLPEEKLKILQRLRNVFNLSYQRYTDIAQAEAQAREAKIEFALERVRSKSMAMHKSEELRDVIEVVYEQFVDLQLPVEHAGFILNYKEENDMHIWFASKQVTPSEIKIPYFDSPHWNSFQMAKAQGKSFFANKLNFEEKNKFYKDLFKWIPPLPDEAIKSIFSRPGLIISTVLLEHVGLYIENYSQTPFTDEEDTLLMRFGKVFQQSYTRFLDLQKAEEQAREAQIEAALEKVRSRTLAMQKSDELAGTAAVLFQQLISLGIEPNRLYIILMKENIADMEAWVTDEDGSKVSMGFTGNYQKNGTLLKMYEGWRAKRKNLVIDMYGDELKEYFHYLHDELKVPFKGGLEQKRRVQHIAYFSHGLIGMASPEEQPAETLQLLERFGAVFNLTFTRFLDLQKAETQAKESELEKKRSEDLLLNILPREIANELKQFGKSYARKHEQVSILFTDIKGFSTISETLSAEELVNQLDECFRAFDHIVGKHGLEKIKTIGDAYICASGLPNPDPDNAVKTVRAAIDMLDFAKGFGMTKIIQDLPAFEFRVGIHTGPVITGVVGLKKFTYDIWGDAVNMAARMEQHGEAGKINISGNTYQLIKDKFTCTHRGKIAAKNKGEVDMYFVERANN